MRNRGLSPVSWTLFATHVGVILFSTVAMLTVLAGSSAIDVTSEPAATIMRVSFRLAGPTYVVLGALSALVFLGARVGWRTATTLAVTTTALALGAELAGTSVGLPFGEYSYSSLLGYRILGLVPFPIPLSWFYMLVASLAIVARLTRAGDDAGARWKLASGAGLLMVAWDLAMDPAMVATGHWRWGNGDMFRGAPDWLEAFFSNGVFYGMPLGNWFGWLLTSTLIGWVMLSLLPPTVIRAQLSPSPLLPALYLANGIMPVALCLRDGFWWAAASGALAMALPVAWSLRADAGRSGMRFSAQRAS